MPWFTGRAVAVPGDDEVLFWVDEGAGGLTAAVSEGACGRVGAVVVGVGGGGIVVRGVDEEAEAEVDGLAEGSVGQTDAMTRGDGFAGGVGDEFAGEECVVEADEVTRRAARVATGGRRDEFCVGSAGVGFRRRVGAGVVDERELRAEGFDIGRRKADGRAGHGCGFEDLFAQVGVERTARDARDEFTEHVPTGQRVVACLFAGNPVRFERHRIDFEQGLFDGLVASKSKRAETCGVGEEVTDGDGVLPAHAELGDVDGHGVVKSEHPAFPKLRDRDGGDGFARAQPMDDGVGLHGHAVTGLAEGFVADDVSVQTDAPLRAKVQALFDAGLKNAQRPREV